MNTLTTLLAVATLTMGIHCGDAAADTLSTQLKADISSQMTELQRDALLQVKAAITKTRIDLLAMLTAEQDAAAMFVARVVDSSKSLAE